MRTLIILSIWSCSFAVFCNGQAPGWAVNAEEYQYNMSVTAQVFLDLALVNSGNNVLGAFVDNEIRGVALPQQVNGEHYYFLTVYSNELSGDTIHFKVYLESADSVYDAIDFLPFQRNGYAGSISVPFHVNISASGDFPIQLLPITADTTLDGIPFDTIDLDEHLITYDDDPVSWTTVPGPNLIASISPNHVLSVDPVIPGWIGTDSILVIATETGTLSNFADSLVALFTIEPNYLGPVFTHIPAQYPSGGLFPVVDINDYLLFNGNSLHYEAELLRPEDTITYPAWIPPIPGGGAMNLIVKANFNNASFTGPGVLAGFVNNQLAGVATAVPVGDETYYFLTLANIASGTIDIQFYDNELEYLYEKGTGLTFIPGGSAGTIIDPVLLELAPMTIEISDVGVWSAQVVDTSYSGIMMVEFRVFDLLYPVKNDTIRVPFILGLCDSQSWAICPGDGLCATADSGLAVIVWFKDGEAVYNDRTLSIFQPGVYHYEGLVQSGERALSCVLTVTEDQGCSGNFPIGNFQYTDTLVLDGNGVVFAETLIEVNDFEVSWNGNGDNFSWHDPANWQQDTVPNQCQHVILPMNAQVNLLSGPAATVWRLTVKPGASLNVNNPGELTIRGN